MNAWTFTSSHPCGCCSHVWPLDGSRCVWKPPALTPALPAFCSFLDCYLSSFFLPAGIISAIMSHSDQHWQDCGQHSSCEVELRFTVDQSASQQWRVQFRFLFLLSLNSESLTVVETGKLEARFLQSISDHGVVAKYKVLLHLRAFSSPPSPVQWNFSVSSKTEEHGHGYCYWNYKMITVCKYKKKKREERH